LELVKPFSLIDSLSSHRFQFQKRAQLFIRVHNKALSVAAMCVSNEDCLPAGIHG
jgi:hypothetical protein